MVSLNEVRFVNIRKYTCSQALSLCRDNLKNLCSRCTSKRNGGK